MQNIHSTSSGKNEESSFLRENSSVLENWNDDQLNKIDDLKKEHFSDLIQKNFFLNLDYIVAITINEEGQFITRDGCEWARTILSNGLQEDLRQSIKKTHYYYLSKATPNSLHYLCSEEHLEKQQYYLYLFANDSSLDVEQRSQYQYDLGNYYYHEKNEERYLEKAFRWYREAAQSGHAQASFAVGYFHEMGLGGMEANHETAMAWYIFASERTQDLMILLYVAQKFEQIQRQEDIDYAFFLYKKCASTNIPLGILSLIEFHERIGSEEDQEIVQKLRKLLPSEYQSCQVSETIEKLYQQELAKRRGGPL